MMGVGGRWVGVQTYFNVQLGLRPTKQSFCSLRNRLINFVPNPPSHFPVFYNFRAIAMVAYVPYSYQNKISENWKQILIKSCRYVNRYVNTFIVNEVYPPFICFLNVIIKNEVFTGVDIRTYLGHFLGLGLQGEL